MHKGTVKIVNPLGLHARAAAQLVKLAGKFKSSIMLTRPDEGIHANAKSLLSVLTLAASYGTVLDMSAEGADEDDAFREILHLFEIGFGEI